MSRYPDDGLDDEDYDRPLDEGGDLQEELEREQRMAELDDGCPGCWQALGPNRRTDCYPEPMMCGHGYFDPCPVCEGVPPR